MSKRTKLWRLATESIVTLASKEATQHPMPFARGGSGGGGGGGSSGGLEGLKMGRREKKVSQAKNGEIHGAFLTTPVMVSSV